MSLWRRRRRLLLLLLRRLLLRLRLRLLPLPLLQLLLHPAARSCEFRGSLLDLYARLLQLQLSLLLPLSRRLRWRRRQLR